MVMNPKKIAPKHKKIDGSNNTLINASVNNNNLCIMVVRFIKS
jgi:hypothetical protein